MDSNPNDTVTPPVVGSNGDEDDLIQITTPAEQPIIKVIGVGGGGGNAVSHMYEEGIDHVSFLVCNTDKKALEDSPVPEHLQLGKDGLGAGGDPEKGRAEAEKSLQKIRTALDDGTKMVFITAGMGGGTGTGAAPLIAREARAKGLLTIGIVTVPFLFEREVRIFKALQGLNVLAKEVDSLLVIVNERLREVYSDLTLTNAFKKADDTLLNAARGIVDIIEMRGIMVVDYRDVCTMLENSGRAIISSGYGEGELRVTKAIKDSLNSPLLSNNNFYEAKNLLMCISASSEHDLLMSEIDEIDDFMSKFNDDIITKYGFTKDDSLGEKVKITILASGFGENEEKKPVKESHTEYDKQIENAAKQIYGPLNSNQSRKRRSSAFFLFGNDDLDNDEIISLVEGTTTLKRSARQLEEIKEKASGMERKPVERPSDDTSTPAGPTTIKFN